MLQLARGVGASVRGDALKTQSHLNPSAHAEKPKAVVSPNAKGSVFRAVSSDSFTRQDVGSGEEEHTLREEINGLNNYRLQTQPPGAARALQQTAGAAAAGAAAAR